MTRDLGAANFIFTGYSGVRSTRHDLVAHHTLSLIVAGSSRAYFEGGEVLTAEGGFRFCKRHTPAKFSKIPAPGGGYKVVSVIFHPEVLQEHWQQLPAATLLPSQLPAILNLPRTLVLRSFFSSLAPYIDDEANRFKQVSKFKVMEAVSILLDLEPAFAGVLFDFSEGGKPELEDFMCKNFRYNLDLASFARLCGRSISSFKRDFEKQFSSTPYEWLKEKRLAEAYQLIAQQNFSPGDAAFHAGFINYSHFSRLFKEKYKRSPSDL